MGICSVGQPCCTTEVSSGLVGAKLSLELFTHIIILYNIIFSKRFLIT